MKIEQIYTGCLSQGAYYIESDGEVAIVDPLREVDQYIQKAKDNHVTINYVLETHFHADFVSGHLDLADKTGAKIIYGPTATPGFIAHIATDGEEFKLGKATIKLLHTPGHTMESATYLLKDEKGKDYAIFTGDTLFIGDVGRPDLAVNNNLTKEDLAGYLYDSLQQKILPLNDDVIICPGHGAGTACGKNLSTEASDTLGNQKKLNYAIRKGITREQFIYEVTEGLLPAPTYFPMNATKNKEGYESIYNILKRGMNALTVAEFLTTQKETNALMLDTRKPKDFVHGFIPGSINIGLDGGFAPWVGTLITDSTIPVLVIADEDREQEVITRLARVGYDKVAGYLKGGFNAWLKAGMIYDNIHSITHMDFEKIFNASAVEVIDVRRYNEFEKGYVKDAVNIPLEYIYNFMSEFSRTKTLYLYCVGGYRSVIAASILKAHGYNNIVNVEGGFNAISNTNVKMVY